MTDKKDKPNYTANNERIDDAVNTITFTNQIKTMIDNLEMWIYNTKDGYYTNDAENRILAHCSHDMSVNDKQSTIIKGVKGRTLMGRNDFIHPDGLINLRNGVLNLDTLKLSTHDPKYNFKYRIEIDYNPEAKCHNFISFLKYAISDKDIDVLQEFSGYGYTTGQKQKKVLIIRGEGDSGKTTFFNTLRELYGGIKFVSAHPLQHFSDPSTHALDGMYGKNANIEADMSDETLKDVSMFKKVVGGDIVSANPKFKETFQYLPDAKQIYGCNKLPYLKNTVDDDEAFWNRLILVEFSKAIQNIDRHYFENIVVNELPGILNWAIEGYQRLKSNGCFSYNNDTTYELWHDIYNRSNPLFDFLNLYFTVELDSEAWVSKHEVRNLFEFWCEQTNRYKYKPTKFTIEFKKLGVKEGQEHKYKDDKTRTTFDVWRGLTIKQPTVSDLDKFCPVIISSRV